VKSENLDDVGIRPVAWLVRPAAALGMESAGPRGVGPAVGLLTAPVFPALLPTFIAAEMSSQNALTP